MLFRSSSSQSHTSSISPAVRDLSFLQLTLFNYRILLNYRLSQKAVENNEFLIIDHNFNIFFSSFSFFFFFILLLFFFLAFSFPKSTFLGKQAKSIEFCLFFLADAMAGGFFDKYVKR